MTADPVLAVSRWLVRAALLAYPAPFRRRHALAMVDLYQERYGEAARDGGLARRVHFVARTLINLVATGFAERWGRGPWGRGGRKRRQAQRKSAGFAGVLQDGRTALRSLARTPRFVITAVIPLAVCIGASTTIFSVVDTVLLRPLPYPEASRLVAVGNTSRRGPGIQGLSVANFRDLAERAGAFEALGAMMSGSKVVRQAGHPPERIPVGNVTPDFLPLLGANVERGRLLVPDDEGEKVVLLGFDIWQRRWGGDPSVVGRAVSIDDESYTVVGVLQRGLRPPELLTFGRPELYLPLERGDDGLWESLRPYPLLFDVVGRLNEAVTIEAARQEVASIAAALAEEYPAANLYDDGVAKGIGVLPLREQKVGQIRNKLVLLLGSVMILLLIGCANLANLFLARGTERRQELALRAALGASRGRLVRLQLMESSAIAAAACAAGVLLAFLGVQLFIRSTPGNIPRLDEIALDGRILGVALLASLLTGLLFGLVPAVRGSGRNLDATLKNAGARAGGGRRERLRAALVIGQTALAVTLVAGAGLLINSFVRLVSVDLGFDPANLAIMSVRADHDLPTDQRPRFFRDVAERVAALPGVASVSGSIFLPATGGGTVVQRVRPVGVDREEEVRMRTALSGYFETLGIPLLRGRTFDAADASRPRVAIVNETLARILFPDGSALGREIVLPDDREEQQRTIVGVVADVRERGPDREVEPILYEQYEQHPWLAAVTLMARYSGPFAPLAEGMQQAVWDVDPTLPVDEVSTLRIRIARSVAEPRFYMLLLGSFSAVALLLAAFGLYATMSYSVAQRTHELGVRMALGARSRDMFALVLRSGLILTGFGLVTGLGVAVFLSKFLQSLLFGITPTDVATYITVSAVLGTVALLGCYFPARRAARADPVDVLKVQ
jgi:putative ABC transport system permease protein